jgi:hypothetical protein
MKFSIKKPYLTIFIVILIILAIVYIEFSLTEEEISGLLNSI